MKNEKDVLLDIQTLKTAGASLRRIAIIYGIPITHGDIWRILHGTFPKGIAKRAALHLPPICPSCSRRIRPALPDWVTTAADWLAAREVTSGVKDRMNVTT